MRLATFNLKDFFDPRGPEEEAVVAAKCGHVAGSLLAANADVVALQEVASDALVEGLLARELAGSGYGRPLFGPRDKRGIGLAMLSRLPILESKVFSPYELGFPRFVDTDPEPFPNRIPLRRGVLHITVDAGALGPVDVITVHFKSKLGAPMRNEAGEPILDPSAVGRAEAALRALIARSAEALHLRKLVDALLVDPQRKLCTLGDFNDVMGSLPLQIVTGIGTPPEQSLISCLDTLPVERRYSVLHRGARELIDQILVSPGLFAHFRAADILNGALRDHGPHDPTAPLAPDSDHALCFADFA
ncbi:MAG: endonuclease/exonuclease/phosphatase family protein [Myxococcales bacterium]|nr:endonuclease/exonuclease/phosphatase family protein [Myxococcales bacterium]